MKSKWFSPKIFFVSILYLFFIAAILLIYPFVTNLGSQISPTLEILCESGCDRLSFVNLTLSVTGDFWESESLREVNIYYYDESGDLLHFEPAAEHTLIIDFGGHLSGQIIIPWFDCSVPETHGVAVGIFHDVNGEMIFSPRFPVDFCPPLYDPVTSQLLSDGEVIEDFFEFIIASEEISGLQLEWSPNDNPGNWQEVPALCLQYIGLTIIGFDAVAAIREGIFLSSELYNFRIKLTDSAGNFAYTAPMHDIQIKMQGNDPPVLLPIGNKEVGEGETLVFEVSGSDPDEDQLFYSATNLPEGADFSNRIFSWSPDFTQAGEYPDVLFELSDGNITVSEAITIYVDNVNHIPVIDPLEDQIIKEGHTLILTIQATDQDGDPLFYLARYLPDGACFDNQTFTWTPGVPHYTAYYQPEFVVSDGLSIVRKRIKIRVIGKELPPILRFSSGVNLSGHAASMARQYGTAFELLMSLDVQYLASISKYQSESNSWQTAYWFNHMPTGENFLLADDEVYLMNARQAFNLNLPKVSEDPNETILELAEGLNLMTMPSF